LPSISTVGPGHRARSERVDGVDWPRPERRSSASLSSKWRIGRVGRASSRNRPGCKRQALEREGPLSTGHHTPGCGLRWRVPFTLKGGLGAARGRLRLEATPHPAYRHWESAMPTDLASGAWPSNRHPPL